MMISPSRTVARFGEAMDTLSADAFEAYRGLVYDEPAFATFFRQMTPLAEIADAQDRLAAGQPARSPTASRICAPFPGCSAGRRRG